MPMKNFEHSIENPLQGEAVKFPYLNKIIDYCNELERRLAEVEKTKVQFVGSPTQGIRPKIFNSGCSSCGKVLLDGKCLDCECSCRSYNNAGVSLCELHKKIHISKN